MKHLLLMRHAKSSWDSPSLQDFDRPLNDRGERDAPRMGKELHRRGAIPDVILCSPAERARKTIQLAASAAKIPVKPIFDPLLYGASSSTLLTVLCNLPEHSECAMLVGHNNGIEELLSRLTGVEEHMPTGAVACVTFELDHWTEIDDGTGCLAWFVTPHTVAD